MWIASGSRHTRQALDLYMDELQREAAMEHANDKDTGHHGGFQGDLVQQAKGRPRCTYRERI